jgi:hypothetical protein
VTSAGEDGKPKTDDDVTSGNATDIQVFYYQIQNRPEFTVPWKREFESLWAILPLVSDEALKRAWEKNPEWRPDEREAYDHWRHNTGVYYTVRETSDPTSAVVDPADPVKGHGVDVLADLKKDKVIPESQNGVLVPAAADFGDRGEAPKEGPAPASDEQYRTYVDKGWRRIVLRELFFEKMFNKALQDARKSKEETEKWDKKGRPGGKPPEKATFESFLTRIAEFQPGQADHDAGVRFVELFKTKAPMTREEIEKFVPLADTMTSVNLGGLKDDAYSVVPTTTKRSLGRAVFHVTKYHADRKEDLADVRDTKVMPLYLQSRSIDRAAKELDRVRTEASASKTPVKIADLVKAAAEKRKFEFFTGSTGTLIAKVGAPEPDVPEGMAPAEVQNVMRRAYVRKNGPDTVGGSGKASEAGSVGRRVLRDDPDWRKDPFLEEPGSEAEPKVDPSKTTDAAYLVQVASRSDPEPTEMNPRRYVAWLRDAALGDESPRSRTPMSQRKGFLTQDLVRWFIDWDDVKRAFQIRTNRPIELPSPALR